MGVCPDVLPAIQPIVWKHWRQYFTSWYLDSGINLLHNGWCYFPSV